MKIDWIVVVDINQTKFADLVFSEHFISFWWNIVYNIFCGKTGVQTAIYLFEVGRPHELDDIVTFIDFSNDVYSRLSRKKSSQEVNLQNTDHALERYAEIEAIVLGKKKKTDYYNEENGLVIKDTISLSGEDWTYSQHQKVDTNPTDEDFERVMSDYLTWKLTDALKGSDYNESI